MPAESPLIAPLPPTARSRVTNGSAVLAGVDGRSEIARRYRDILAAITAEAFAGDPTEAQLQLARRAASLSVWAEDQEAAMARGERLDVAAFTTAVNALRRLLQDIGLERRARQIGTVDPLDYAKSKARAA